jgi:hypothetical protein
MLCSNNPISQPSLEICPIWFPLINKEFKNEFLFIHGLHARLGFVVGAWFHQQRMLIGLLLPHILIYWKHFILLLVQAL